MFVVNLFPEWVFIGLLFAAVAGYIIAYAFSQVPFVSQYSFIIRAVSAIVIVVSVWSLGAKHNESIWQTRVTELESKLVVAEAASQKQNVDTITKIVTKTKYIRQKAHDRVQYIEKEIVKYDNQCKIPSEFVKVINEAAENSK